MRKNRKKELRNTFHKSYKGRPTILKGQKVVIDEISNLITDMTLKGASESE